MRTISLIILFLIGSISWGQNYAKELQRIMQEFSALEAYHIKARVNVGGENEYDFGSSVQKSKYGIWIKSDASEMLLNRQYAIAIDHDDKTIRVDRGDFMQRTNGKGDVGLEAIADITNQELNVEFIGKNSEYRTYVIYNNSAISKTVVKISNKTNFFYEIEVFYVSEDVSIPYYKVNYTTFLKNPAFTKMDFSQTSIFTQPTAGELVLTEKYKGYSIIKQYE